MNKIGCVQHDCDECLAAKDTIRDLKDLVHVERLAQKDMANVLNNYEGEITRLRAAPTRDDVLEEVAREFDKMKVLGNTSASFAAYVRGMKSCPKENQ